PQRAELQQRRAARQRVFRLRRQGAARPRQERNLQGPDAAPSLPDRAVRPPRRSRHDGRRGAALFGAGLERIEAPAPHCQRTDGPGGVPGDSEHLQQSLAPGRPEPLPLTAVQSGCMLKLSRPAAEVFIPDGTSWEAASARVTHLVVAAHADDVELMAWHAVLHAEGLAAVIVTGGDELRDTRLREQKRAASLGRYAAVIWLDHASADVK